MVSNTKLMISHPGKLLKEYFLDELHITAYQLAKAIGVQQTRISEIIHSKRNISVETGLKLSRYFGLSERYWIDLQANYEIRKYLSKNKDEITAIPSLSGLEDIDSD